MDRKLLEFGTPRQKEIYQAILDTGSMNQAAKHLDVTRQTVADAVRGLQRDATRHGYSPEHDWTRTQPQPVHGVSTWYPPDPENGIPYGQWVKTRAEKETQDDEARLAAIKDVVESFKYQKISIKPPVNTEDDLLNVFPWGDPHFGMLSWKPETGEDYDLNIATQIHRAAMIDLLSTAPKASTALLLNLGDYFHFDNDQNVTERSGNFLDGDGRAHKVFQIGYRCFIEAICMLLQTHKKVIVRSNKGNHDPYSAMHMTVALAEHFRDNDRVQIEDQPSAHWAMQFGRVAIGSTHGHTVKPVKFGEIIMTDFRHLLSSTDYFYVYGGHVHHEESKEYGGYRYESFPTLASKDAYAHEGGYRARRAMFRITIHKQDGEDGRGITSFNRLKRLGLMK